MGIKEDPDKPGTFIVSHHKRHPLSRTPISIRRKGFKSLAEAKREFSVIVGEVEDRVKRQITPKWADLVEQWELAVQRKDIFVTSNLGSSAFADYRFVLRKYTSDWNDKYPAEITRHEAWLKLSELERQHSIGRRKRLRSAIDAVYRWAILSHKITASISIPTEGFKSTLREEEKQPEILTISEIKLLLMHAKEQSHDWYFHWAMALFTGMRSGELYALEWDQVDFDNRMIFVHRNWTHNGGFGPTKGRYWRTVPIESSEVLGLLKELKLKAGGRKEVLRRFKDWNDGYQAKILRQFCDGIGLRSIKFHTLRACFATQLIRDAVAPAVVMKICGWKDLKTMQRYIRLAGIEVKGATMGLKFLPPEQTMARVVELFSGRDT